MKALETCTVETVWMLSPVGRIQLCGCGKGLHSITLQASGPPPEGKQAHPPACVLCEGQGDLPPDLRLCADWLQAYFHQPQSVEKLPLPSFHHPMLLKESFTSRVLHTLLEEVGVGQTVSYKHLAEMAGNSKAVRAVGGAMKRNPVPLLIPCHRVIRSSGDAGGYMGAEGTHLKQWLLAHERTAGPGAKRGSAS